MKGNQHAIMRSSYRVSNVLVDLGWVGLTLIWVFHHLVQLLGPFCQMARIQ